MTEQKAILDFIQSKREVKSSHHFLHKQQDRINYFNVCPPHAADDEVPTEVAEEMEVEDDGVETDMESD